MGADFQILNVPELPHWGTDAAQAVRPGGGAGGVTPEMRAGFSPDDRPPARWLNWLWRANYGWARAALGGALARWDRTAPHGITTPFTNIPWGAYHPGPGSSVAGHIIGDALTAVRHSYGGRAMQAGTANGGLIIGPRAFGIDSANVLVGQTGAAAPAVAYAPSIINSAWSTPSTTATPLSLIMSALGTKWPNGDLLIAVGDAVGIKSDGAAGGGAWTTPTTAPSEFLTDLVYAGGTTWYASGPNGNGSIWRSTDDGDNWVAVAGTAPTGTADVVRAMARCPQTTRQVLLVDDHWPLYSDDGGANWTEASVVGSPDAAPNIPTQQWRALKAVGGGAFVATANNVDEGTLIYSVDGGETWRWVEIEGAFGGLVATLRALWCDGTRVYGLGDDGHIYASGALDAAGVPDVGLL